MLDEQDTCRICSAPAEPGQPLFHPCKCSGTIRYIHQDCLTTWLAHSRKKTCDVCKYQYTFTKIYSPTMPKQLPVILFVRRLAQQTLWAILLGLRGVLVAIIWLALLPYITVWTWRFYFIMGDQIAWWINDRPRPHNFSTGIHATNMTSILGSKSLTPLSHSSSPNFWLTITSDIFAGQIIASLIVLIFLGVFLLREWIMQNARPGVFEDDERHAEHVQQMEAQQFQPVDPQVENEVEVQGEPQDDIPEIGEETEESQHRPNVGLVLPAIAEEPEQTVLDDPNPTEASSELSDSSWRAVGSSSLQQDIEGVDGTHDHSDNEDPWEDLGSHRSTRHRSHKDPWIRRQQIDEMRKRRHAEEIGPSSRSLSRPSGLRSSHNRSASGHRIKPLRRTVNEDGQDGPVAGPSRLDLPPLSSSEDFQFTFRMDTLTPEYAQPDPATFSFDAPEDHVSLFEYQPTSELPYPISPLSNSFLATEDSSSVFAESSGLRRPPLPNTTVPHPQQADMSSEHITKTYVVPQLAEISQNSVPSNSPGLASYRAPEDLLVEAEAGPSTRRQILRDYPDSDSDTADERDTSASRRRKRKMREQQDIYFKEPEGSTSKIAEAPTSPDSDEEDEEEWDEPAEIIPDVDEVEDMDGDDEDREQREGQDEGQRVRIRIEIGGGNGVNVDVQADDDRPVNPQGQGNANVQPGNEDPDANLDEDLDGAIEVMEAVGIRGPFTSVFQNAALLLFALDTTIGLAVFVPFTIGKTTALLSLEPPRLLQIILLPIRIIRLISDPIVDSISFILRYITLTFFGRLSHLFISSSTTPEITVPKEADRLLNDTATAIETILIKWDQFIGNVLANVPSSNTSSESNVIVDMLSSSGATMWDYVEPYFATLGRKVRLTAVASKGSWTNLAVGDNSASRFFAVVLGYAVVGTVLALYMNIITVSSMQSAGRALRAAVRQQLVVLKVATFVVIELVLFPFGCGIMLDLCTLHLFPDTTIFSRLSFFMYAPVTATFYHWMIGTMFMYQFAMILAGCRTIMRSGAMWFIKDPQDQNFHPIRDILDRPTIVQLRKLAISAVMYSVVVACGMGSIIILFCVCGSSFVPLRWKMREPLSEIPIDLLFLHIVVPLTVQHLRPKKAIRDLATQYWRWAAHQLRLTSYMFGGRHPSEEYSMRNWTWTSLLWRDQIGVAEEDKEFDGSFRRVPAGDSIALPKDLRAIVSVDENGEPLDDTGRELIDAQDAEARKEGRSPTNDYTVVYVPPNFRHRIITFIITLWLCTSAVLVLGTGIPILLGRGAFKLLMKPEVHDPYSFILGFYLLWGSYSFGKSLDTLDKRRQRSSSIEKRADFALFATKRGLLWLSKVSWMVFWLGIVIPTLVAIVVDVYIVLPLRLVFSSGVELRIHVVEAWALGLVYSKMILRTKRLRPQTRFDAALKRIKQEMWQRPDAITATVDVIIPVTFGLLGMLLLPLGVVWGLQRMHVLPPNGKLAFLYVFPSIFVVAFIAQVCHAIINLCGSWAQSIRDSEFLVEMRLRNLDSLDSPNKSGDSKLEDTLPKEFMENLEGEVVEEAELLENNNQ